jgi:oxygen-independent coproporphyrinogen-3 oxidase
LPADDLSHAQEAGALHRNFMGYTLHGDCDLIGLGVSAIGCVGACYSQNLRDLPGWERAVDAGRLPVWRGIRLDADDLLRADVIQSLMCTAGIAIPRVEADHGIEFRRYFADALARLAPLAADGLVEVSDAGVTATAAGRLLLRVIAMCFDRYLESSRPARFSRVI